MFGNAGKKETISAIATAVGGGVGIVRVSGPLAQSIAARLCRPWPVQWQSHHLYLVDIVSDTTQESPPVLLDQGLFCIMKGPHSYTGEDVLEIHGHGGRISLQQILDATIQAGARHAAPGEFTKRAFLAGKMDLTQAEAVAALVAATSVQAGRHATRQMGGQLKRLIAETHQTLIFWLAAFEGSLDFPDLEEDRKIHQDALAALVQVEKRLGSLRKSFDQGGKILQSGLEVALVGQTNAGKSSLLNALYGDERALVDASPGTTRDVIEVSLRIQGIQVTLLDTAGQRAEASLLEQQGIKLAKARGQQADLVLLVIDGTIGFDEITTPLLHGLQQNQLPYLVVWNKMDRAGYLPLPTDVPVVACSALCGWGIDALKERIMRQFLPSDQEDVLLVNPRQTAVLDRTLQSLHEAVDALTSNQSWDLVAAALRRSASALAEMTGEQTSDSILDSIFGQFCVGK